MLQHFGSISSERGRRWYKVNVHNSTASARLFLQINQAMQCRDPRPHCRCTPYHAYRCLLCQVRLINFFELSPANGAYTQRAGICTHALLHPTTLPRNHLPVPPEKDPVSWQLSVGGEEARSVSLSVEDLKRLWVTVAPIFFLFCNNLWH